MDLLTLDDLLSLSTMPFHTARAVS